MDKIQKGAIYAFFTLTVPEVLRNHRHSVRWFLKTTRVGKYLVLSLFTEVLRNHRHSVWWFRKITRVGKYLVFKQIISPLKRIYQNGKIDSG